MSDDRVVLLDADGRPVGTAPKLAAHQPPGRAHLAFSVVLRDPHGDVLLQRRAATKHHFALRWGNSCCSHPRPGELLVTAAHRRVREELGLRLDGTLRVHGAFWYRAADPETGLVEHEYDVVVGATIDRDTVLAPDPAEVDDLRWTSWTSARRRERDRDVAPWLSGVMDVVEDPAAHRVVPIAGVVAPSDDDPERT